MALRLCDFTNQAGFRVRLSASPSAPLAYLQPGKAMVVIDVNEARLLRDALSRFIDAASTLVPHAAAYAEQLRADEPPEIVP
jgi:hypothetical protein